MTNKRSFLFHFASKCPTEKRKKVTEEQAKMLAEAYRVTGNLANLINGVSYFSSWFGRFGAMNRLRFTEALIQELGVKNEEKKENKDDHIRDLLPEGGERK